jgi:hypothetical protein
MTKAWSRRDHGAIGKLGNSICKGVDPFSTALHALAMQHGVYLRRGGQLAAMPGCPCHPERVGRIVAA